MPTIAKHGKVVFSETEIQFIKDNFATMTNAQIAEALNVKNTILRMTAYGLGLQRIKLEYWSDEAVAFLKENYHRLGDREICRIFSVKFPKTKGWTPRHIQKKMSQLNLHRNKMDWFLIKERNRDNGSFGKRNPKNVSQVPKVFYQLNPKTRIELRPGQTIDQLKKKYNDTTI
jgi:hypothetical protein